MSNNMQLIAGRVVQ